MRDLKKSGPKTGPPNPYQHNQIWDFSLASSKNMRGATCPAGCILVFVSGTLSVAAVPISIAFPSTVLDFWKILI